MLKKIQKHHIFLVLLILFAAILLPSTSPIGFHDVKCMTNDYFNFAKSMIQGDRLYVDLFDHKGIVLFLLYYIPVLISDTSLIGVFLFEALISAGITTTCYGYLKNKNKCSKTASLIITFVTVIILKLVFSQTMLNTEPICILIAFLLLRYIDNKEYEKYKKTDYILFGLAFGLLFWMKYPMVIVLFPFWLYICIQSVRGGKTTLFIKRCFISFITVVAMSVPIMWYFLHNNIVEEMFCSYFASLNNMEWVFIGSLLEISIALISVIAIIGMIMTGKTDKTKMFFAISFICIFFLSNIGGVRAYTASPIIVLLPMYLPDVWKGKYVRPIAVGVLALIILLYMPKGLHNNSSKIEELAGKYNITNDNILYLCEDLGFGTYSPDSYREKGQWLPGRITYNNDKEYYERTMKWIEEKEFQYICVTGIDFDAEISNEEYATNNYAQIIKATQDNYEIVESFIYNESVPVKYYVLQTKEN